MNDARVQIFIDGSNLYHRALKPLGMTAASFNFEAFARFLANGRTVTNSGKRYYIGTVREKEGDLWSKRLMAQQLRLFSMLRKTHWQIKTSKLQERQERLLIDHRVLDSEDILQKGITSITYRAQQEKGINVKIAVDIIAACLDDQCDTAILVSSDADLIPMIDWVRFRLKKCVEYIGFSIPKTTNDGSDIYPTQALIHRTDSRRILGAQDMRAFLQVHT